jgi:hypothetical protein
MVINYSPEAGQPCVTGVEGLLVTNPDCSGCGLRVGLQREPRVSSTEAENDENCPEYGK